MPYRVAYGKMQDLGMSGHPEFRWIPNPYMDGYYMDVVQVHHNDRIHEWRFYTRQMHAYKQDECKRCFSTVIPADGTIAGYLPAPQTEPTRKDYAIMGTASDGTRVMIADCHHVDITPKDEHSFLSSYVRDWYMTRYPDDTLGEELPFSLTFQDVVDALPNDAVYDVLGVSDSVIRERVFEELADIYGVGYGVIYDAWANKKPIQQSVKKAQPELPKPAPKPVKKQTARKNAKPSKTLKFPFAKDLIIDGEKCGKCTEIQEFAKAYSFITYNGVFQCTKNDKIQSNGFEIRVTTTK